MAIRSTLLIGLLLLQSPATRAQETQNNDGFTQVDIGRRIYETGILADSTLLQAKRSDGFSLQGSVAACVTCHRRSGMGDIEGQAERTVLVPPISAPVLFKPARFANAFLDPAHHYVPNKAWARALTRPAYDDVSLARAIRSGVDSAARPLSLPMLTYDLDDNSMSALLAYLHTLNNKPTPGQATDGSLHVATVITSEILPEQAGAVLDVVRVWMNSVRPLGKSVHLHEWRLSGDPSEWSRQLIANYQTQPVFAIVSGIGASHWLPVQQFCETNSLPCILPSVEVVQEPQRPDNGEPNYYSIYYSSGVTLEARLLARYLKSQKQEQNFKLLQIYGDDSGKTAANTLLQQAKFPTGVVSVRRLRLTAPTSVLSDITAEDSVMLWLRADDINLLVDSWQTPLPKRIYLSALLAPPENVHVPMEWKRRIAFVSLFDDLSVQGEIARVRLTRWLTSHNLKATDLRLQADAYTACYLFNAAVAKIRSQEIRRPAVPLSREHVLEMLENLIEKYADGTEQIDPDSHVAFYGRMSLGPRQRFAVRGGNIQHYEGPDYKRFVAESDRIVP